MYNCVFMIFFDLDMLWFLFLMFFFRFFFLMMFWFRLC